LGNDEKMKKIEGEISCLEDDNLEMVYRVLKEKSISGEEIMNEEFLIVD
jgi:hypothetical protein